MHIISFTYKPMLLCSTPVIYWFEIRIKKTGIQVYVT